MNWRRFTTKRLFALISIVAVSLYVLYVRPTAVAHSFAREVIAASKTDLSSVSREYFQGMRTDEASLKLIWNDRTWTDILRCRRRFTLEMRRPYARTKNELIVCVREFSASPLNVHHLGGPITIARTCASTK